MPPSVRSLTRPVPRPLYDSWGSFCRAALLLLRSHSNDLPLAVRSKRKHVVTDEGSWTVSSVNAPSYSTFLFLFSSHLTQLAEYGLLEKILLSNGGISRHVDQVVGVWGIFRAIPLWEYATYPVLKQLTQKAIPFDFDEDLFNRTVIELMDFVENDSARVRCIALLENFQSDADEFEVGPGVKIRRMTNLELGEFADSVANMGWIPFHELSAFRFAVDLTFESPKRIGDTRPGPAVDPTRHLDSLTTSMRIFKEGDVNYRLASIAPVCNIVEQEGHATIFHGPYVRPYVGFKFRPFILNVTDQFAFREFWRSFKDQGLTESEGAIGLALRRFNFGYDRIQPEDRLIDYMIAFEALFLADEKSELRHRLSVRVAKLLGGSFEQKRKVVKEMKEFYDKRSSIVHRGKIQLEDEVLVKTEGYLRTSIKLFLTKLNHSSREEILERLDLD